VRATAPGRAAIRAWLSTDPTVVDSAVLLVAQKVATVQLSADSLVLRGLQRTAAVQASARDANGHVVEGAPLQWETSDPAVATVDAAGRITSRGAGRARLSAHVDGVSASLEVRVEVAAARIVLAAGDAQVGTVGEELPDALVAQVVDEDGQPLAGTVVEWQIRTPGGAARAAGAVSHAVSTADWQGRVQVRWRLGETAGPQFASARVQGADVALEFRATARAGAPQSGRKTRGGDQDGLVVSFSLTDVLQIEVTDRYGNPVPGAEVRWTVQEGNGRFGTTSVQHTATDSAGLSSILWHVGTVAGRTSVLAEVFDANGGVAAQAEFVNLTRPAPLSRLNLTPRQASLAALDASVEFSVRPTDDFGNDVAGTTVGWQSSNVGVLEAAAVSPGRAVGRSRDNGTAQVVVAGSFEDVAVADSAVVVVEQTAVGAISVKRGDDVGGALTVRVGQSITLVANGVDANGQALRQFRWSVADGSAHATILGSDRQPQVQVRGTSPGRAVVRVQDPGGASASEIELSVIAGSPGG
jgi:hypothetical protein